MFVGTLPIIDDHLAWAFVSFGTIDAGCQMAGNELILVATGA